MNLFPFTTIQSYADMLKKFSFFTFFIVSFLIFFLGNQVPELNESLNRGDVAIEVLKINVPLTNIILAILITFISRAIKLHDRLSDVFGIRSRFEINHILLPMANLLDLDISEESLEKLIIKENRDDVMYGNFYKYASSDPEKTVIDRHSVTLALDQWSWFWIILKTMFFSLISGFILLFYREFFYVIVGIVLELLLLLLLRASYRISIRLARRQVKEILDDDARKNKIKNNLIALQS